SLSLVEQGNKQLASEMAETAIRLNPRHAEAFAALGETRAELRDSVGAERAFATAVDLNPYNPELKARELRFLARTGQKDVANNGLKDLAARYPYSAGVWVCWGDVQLIRGEYADAILSYQNAIGRTPGLMRAHLGMIECYARMGNSSETALAFQRASEINPRHPFLLELRRRFSS
ncbi:MAG: tetratricopeptide repeat protein, partial [Elusimicrobia bacterium]|nr:tetratricopeptide repeat protein [Elusimicrobiota bacterium]